MNYTITLTQEQINILIDKYQDNEIFSTNNYTLFRAKIKLSTLSVYSTGKLLIQGKDAYDIYLEICNLFSIEPIQIENKIENDNKKSEEITELFSENIGNDEVGTGDFFGPIVVCSSYVSQDNYIKIKRLGVKDSKALTDEKITKIASELIDIIPYSVTILKNSKYNEVNMTKNMNMNRIKAILHNNVMNKFIFSNPDLKDKQIVLDDFCGEDKYYDYLSKSKNVIKNIHFETKAEIKYLSVACSSIIARYYFLQELERMSLEAGVDLPKGAGPAVDRVASQIIKSKGTRFLSTIAKLNFKNFTKANKILDNTKR